jgi:hypothetical protein
MPKPGSMARLLDLRWRNAGQFFDDNVGKLVVFDNQILFAAFDPIVLSTTSPDSLFGLS